MLPQNRYSSKLSRERGKCKYCFSKYSPKLIQELLHSLASGGLPHKSVVRVYKGEGILLRFVVNAKQQRGG